MATVQRMTAQEYLALPDEWEQVHSELIEGEVVVSSPDITHQRVCRNIFRALDGWTQAASDRGEVTFPLDVLID